MAALRFGTLLVAALLATIIEADQPSEGYTRQWAVHIAGGAKRADAVAGRHDFINLGKIVGDWFHFEHPNVVKRSAEPCEEHHKPLTADPEVVRAEQQLAKKRVKRSVSAQLITLNDPYWHNMWYLNRGGGLDMNVQAAWKEGITGRGIVVTILDDGLEKNHPDLHVNYDPQASYDVNNHDADPMPRYDMIDSNRHGTRCAGEVAAAANNSLCAVGVAFGAGVGGVRMLDGDVTDAVEARSLSLNPQHVDIYSASWGPDDDGKTVDGPGELATRAFIEGVTRGRGGLGSIYIWASGNGGRDQDDCNCDGYTNSIWTLSISSATEHGSVPWYSEACSSTLAATYSSGAPGEKQVATTDLHATCTNGHTGTSASAPLAAGICALALEANRALTWRDMQHIVVRTARPVNLRAKDWATNGVGRNVSHSFGYGLMDAAAMVQLARRWVSVPEQRKCEVSWPNTEKIIPAKSQVSLPLVVRECPGVRFLEHVQAKVTLTSSKRGDLQITLKSPSGTRSRLLARRPHDMSRAGFQAWPFMSVHSWGENPLGTWYLEVHNEGRYLANLTQWALILHGTETAPGESPPAPSSSISENIVNDVEPSPATSSAVIVSTTPPQASSGSAETAPALFSSSGSQHSDEGIADSSSHPISGDSSSTMAESATNSSALGPCLGWLDKDSNCLPCHYTCKACSGPNDYQCSKCHDDAVLIEPNSLWKFLIFKKPINESYCYPDSLVPRISRAIWYYWLALACAMIVILGAVIWAASCIFSDMFKRNRPGYSPVATDINYH